MCSITLMTIIIHVCLLLLINILDIYYITNVLHYFDAHCKCLLHHVYVFLALIVVLRSGIILGWLIYLYYGQMKLCQVDWLICVLQGIIIVNVVLTLT